MRQNIYPISSTNGLKVFIQELNYPSPTVFDTPISLESGKETSIIIEKTLASSLSAPYGSCNDLSNGFNSDLYDYISKTNNRYQQKDCLNAGYQQEIQKGKLYLQGFYFIKLKRIYLQKLAIAIGHYSQNSMIQNRVLIQLN